MLVISFYLSQSFICAPYLFCNKRFKSEINCFCIRTLNTEQCTEVYNIHISNRFLSPYIPIPNIPVSLLPINIPIPNSTVSLYLYIPTPNIPVSLYLYFPIPNIPVSICLYIPIPNSPVSFYLSIPIPNSPVPLYLNIPFPNIPVPFTYTVYPHSKYPCIPIPVYILKSCLYTLIPCPGMKGYL